MSINYRVSPLEREERRPADLPATIALVDFGWSGSGALRFDIDSSRRPTAADIEADRATAAAQRRRGGRGR